MVEKIKAVIFDWDGTLVYTNKDIVSKQTAKKILEILKKKNLDVSFDELLKNLKEVFHEHESRLEYDRNKRWKAIGKLYGVEMNDKEYNELTVFYWNCFKENTRFFPDTKEILEYLKPKYKLGLLTDFDGTKGIKIGRINVDGMLSYFDAIVISGEDSKEVKPHVKPFKLICKKLDSKPEECIMIGDRIESDITGARNAGMKHIFVGDTQNYINKNVNIIIKDLKEIKNYL